jgi:hypothetical protein
MQPTVTGGSMRTDVLSGSLKPDDRVVVGAEGGSGGLTFEVVEGATREEGTVTREFE